MPQGHIFENPGSRYYFGVLNMSTSNVKASIDGEFTAPNTASGTIRVVDYRRDLQERMNHTCTLTIV